MLVRLWQTTRQSSDNVTGTRILFGRKDGGTGNKLGVTDSAVEMIPFGLLTGFYGKKEIRITKLAEEGFCFRSAEKFCGLEKSFRFCFYDLRQSRYREIPVIPVAWRTEAENRIFHQLCGGSTARRLSESGVCAVLPV